MRKNRNSKMYRMSWSLWGAAALTVLLACVAPAGADSFRDLTWNEMDSGVTGMIWTLSGSSLSNFYYGELNSTSIRKYNSSTGAWDADASWTTHLSGNGNWSGITDTSLLKVSGNNVYVVARDQASGYVGYFNGASWSDLATGTTRCWQTLTADGTTVVPASKDGRIPVMVAGVGYTYVNIYALAPYAVSNDNNGSGVHWVADASGKVVKSTDGGLSYTGVTALPTSGASGPCAVHSIDADHAIISQANGGEVYRTSDGGSSWSLVGGSAFDSGGNVRGIYVNGWDDIVAYGSFNGLWHWDGTDWAHITLPDHLDSESLRAMAYVDGNYWVAGNDGTMYSTLPEPATLSLLAAGGLGVLLRRRK